MQPQTRRQKEVLDIINRFVRNRGFKPSYQQIARELGVRSKSGVAKHIKALEQLGCISRKRENGTFCLELQSENPMSENLCRIEWLEIPSDPNQAEDWELEPIFVPRLMIGFNDSERISAFRVNDDAMLDSHICQGDIVLLERRIFARDGDIIVALIEKSKAVLRKHYRLGSKIELRPDNSYFESLLVSADKIQIKGILKSVMRPAI